MSEAVGNTMGERARTVSHACENYWQQRWRVLASLSPSAKKRIGDSEAKASSTRSCAEQLGQPWHKKPFEAHCTANSVWRPAASASDRPAPPTNGTRAQTPARTAFHYQSLGDKRKTCGALFALTPRTPVMPKLRGSDGKHRKHSPKPLVCALLCLPPPKIAANLPLMNSSRAVLHSGAARYTTEKNSANTFPIRAAHISTSLGSSSPNPWPTASLHSPSTALAPCRQAPSSTSEPVHPASSCSCTPEPSCTCSSAPASRTAAPHPSPW
ncbi:hypothetical protein, conserved in T.vivax [Trypanosoma vivax Y486]|uniref:Uncharacterized protein n=1 Tax=Trypanosoma vivax (strain Y486) TaxID=1055687 RepID=F9WRJ3_TRYVY|nr:hypothetical protein, conserved in T.vivax [Trypanosoma vivax Y486]|eukprot:CCD20177.1 hypothetical protein, conserved in T.vivax [Trypanosoma vivax Y486]